MERKPCTRPCNGYSARRMSLRVILGVVCAGLVLVGCSSGGLLGAAPSADDGTSLRTWSAADGRPCREFQQTLTGGYRNLVAFGTACRTPAGRWHIVRLTGPSDSWRYRGDVYDHHHYYYGRHWWPYHLFGNPYWPHGTGVHIGVGFSTRL